MNKKSSNFENIKKILEESYQSNHMTNGGPVVTQLEMFFSCLLDIDKEHCVIAATNGASALHTMISGIDLYHGRKLRYCTQSFTFPCAVQGSCQDSYIVDLNSKTLSIDLDKIPSHCTDGIIVTNLFGNIGPLDVIVQWAKDNNKILIFDNATVPLNKFFSNKDSENSNTNTNTDINDGFSSSSSDSEEESPLPVVNINNISDGSFISLHHTKPLGFGEGGLIIVDKKYESCVRKCLNFGFSPDRLSFSTWGNNGKMSDIAAAFILDYVSHNFTTILTHTKIILKLFTGKLQVLHGVKLFPNYGIGSPLLSCFALIFDSKIITNEELLLFEKHGITAKKYYAPLKDLPVSSNLYSKILCLPLHLEVDENILNTYIDIIKIILEKDQNIIESFNIIESSI